MKQSPRILAAKKKKGKKDDVKNRRIRIHIDYKQSDAFVKKFSEANPKVVDLYKMSKRIVSNIQHYFTHRLNVTTPIITKFKKEVQCAGISIKPYSNKIDLYVVIKAEWDQNTSYFAAASSCIFD